MHVYKNEMHIEIFVQKFNWEHVQKFAQNKKK